ncbi:T9SS type A sorting domain-containing protein [Chryseobacterium indologenes]|uniref:T9SS type A sorting domain-containing protein n=1 Tax=Chryseobacterium indologenes TaxID=253 RepID=UPI004059D6C0
MKIYPNPAKDVINIELPDSGIKNFTFEITDFQGRSIFRRNNETSINASGLENGAYIGILKIGDQKVVRKVMIER